MPTKRIANAAQWAKGAVKETVGKRVGDVRMQAEGTAERAAGKVQHVAGGTQHATLGGGNRDRR
jgi:uncharacterized protein YjbJ (UPF0337 family)